MVERTLADASGAVVTDRRSLGVSRRHVLPHAASFASIRSPSSRPLAHIPPWALVLSRNATGDLNPENPIAG
jgi:hypothetical protein